MRTGKTARMVQELEQCLRETTGPVALVAHSQQFARSYILPMLPAELRSRVHVITPASAHRARGFDFAGWYRDHHALHDARPGQIIDVLDAECMHRRTTAR